MAKPTFTADLIPNSVIIEVCKFEQKSGKFVGMKLMSHGDFKAMEKQIGFRYQEYQKGYSQFKIK